LIITPLAVSIQVILEAEKFGFDVKRSNDGSVTGKIVVTNYEKLEKFNWQDWYGVIADESSRIKNDRSATRYAITNFLKKIPYRLLATATAAPNDYIELGTSSEALGYLGSDDMLAKFFVNDQNNTAHKRMYGVAQKMRFRGHAETPFWRWVCSWARAIRKPSDYGFADNDFILPELKQNYIYVDTNHKPDGFLFDCGASNLREQRSLKRNTIVERCEKVAELVNHDQPAIVWCHLNDEGDLLEKIIPDAIQVAGKDSDNAKEEKIISFTNGESRVLVTKQKIAGWGMNWQHCNHMTFFPDHSYEQLYQAIRRCWRFGQKRPVTVDIVMTEGEKRILLNMERKQKQADVMFDALVEQMNNAVKISRVSNHNNKGEVPEWM